MKKLYPRPRLSLLLCVVWLLVQLSISIDQVLMGVIMGTIIPLITLRFWPDAPQVRNGGKLVRYMGVFLYDIVIANLQVAWWIIQPQRNLKPCFVYMPLEVEHPFTITVLASTISLTPGTVSSHVSGDRKLLIVHCLHSDNPEETMRQMKERYELPLKEIFG